MFLTDTEVAAFCSRLERAWNRYIGAQADESDAQIIQEAFADSQVYLGAFYPPNRIARQRVTLIHGASHLEGAREVSPGIFTGGTALLSQYMLT